MVVRKRGGGLSIAPLEVPEVVAVDAVTECHVTPLDVAARMAEYLDPADCLTLEPEAGTGNLIHALYESGQSYGDVVAIERHQKLCTSIRARFKNRCPKTLIQGCFLDYAAENARRVQYPRVIMNPPFRQVKKHMKAALSLLGSAGLDNAVLVALVPITYEHSKAEVCEVLNRETFPNAKVMTKIIKIEC